MFCLAKKTLSTAAWFAICGSLGLLPLTGRSEVAFGSLFTDHAVLQHSRVVPVWGTATPGEAVTVSFLDQTQSTKADKNGRWMVQLSPMKPGQTGVLAARGGNNEIKLADVVTGEVWLCSGQSNMEFTVKRASNADKEIAAANFPMIRQFKVQVAYSVALRDSVKGAWQPCSPQTVPVFTAVGYFFARDLYQALHIPIGIINSTKGGSAAEAWISPEALDGNPKLKFVRAGWPQKKADMLVSITKMRGAKQGAAEVDGEKPANGIPQGVLVRTPNLLFGSMIHPLIPYAIRGVLWYQGEENSVAPAGYHDILGTLIQEWRQRWGEGDMPFYLVQLPNLGSARPGWTVMREEQQKLLALPQTGLAVTIDVGRSRQIHYPDKQDVGHRLALIAEAQTYGMDVPHSGPTFVSQKIEGSRIRLTFAHTDKGLVTRDGQPPLGFVIAGNDKNFQPAQARIDGQDIVVSSPQVSAPIAVRYLWENDPKVNLYNGVNLPAVPFRTDNWDLAISGQAADGGAGD